MAPKSRLHKPVYIRQALRSPIGKFGGSLAGLPAPRLAAQVLAEGLKKQARKPDYVLLGHARQAGNGPNPARQATCFSGAGVEIPAWTLNQACASGMAAVAQAADLLQLGRATSVWAGGVESMSRTPYLLPQARWGQKMGNQKLVDAMYQDGLHCPMADMIMGATVQHIATEEKIMREEQDRFALASQQKADAAIRGGLFKDEIVPIVDAASGKVILALDEHPRADSTLETLGKLAPVFDPQNGTITAGNASGITDGTAWLELTSTKDSACFIEILDYETTALEPLYMGHGPIRATELVLQRNGLQATDIDFVEINEAFAAQVIACQRRLKFPEECVNVRGGSIALGHPIGATGARILTTLAHTMKGQSGALGIATLCVSGGMGFTFLVRTT
ncbi:MAG TPA: acetyl-CoA C-acyltransferase [Bdellovibrionota bacterium]|nr:acetyl-CoA C-acyltransferase [Bdellovibrionota bacterium]